MKLSKERVYQLKRQYPNRIPCIVLKHPSCHLPKIQKNKYLVPFDITFGQFTFIIRKQLKLNPQCALFLLINDKMIPQHLLLSDVYKQEKNKNDYLEIFYIEENVFG